MEPTPSTEASARSISTVLLQQSPVMMMVVFYSAAIVYATYWTESDPLKCVFFVFLLSLLLLTDAISAPVAALFPIFMLPMLGLATTGEISRAYSDVTQFSFLSIMFLVLAAVESGLYSRLALLFLSTFGCSAQALLFSVIVPSVLVSLLFGSYLCTMLLWPIVDCVTDELFLDNYPDDQRKVGEYVATGFPSPAPDINTSCLPAHAECQPYLHRVFESRSSREIHTERDQLRNTLLLGLVYGTSIGCTGTPHGTLPNRRLFNFVNSFYGHHPLNYFTWFAYSIPALILCSLILWLYLFCFGVPSRFRVQNTVECRKLFKMRYTCLGKMKFHEVVVALMQISVLLSNIVFRGSPTDFSEYRFGSRASFFVAIGSLVFIIPAIPVEGVDSPPLLSWSNFCSRMPWGCIFLCGAGMIVAKVAATSGMYTALLEHLIKVQMPAMPVVMLMCLLTAILAELKNFRRREEIFWVPALNLLALEKRANPLLFMLPISRLSCMTLVLPVANYPNAMLYEYASIPSWQLIKSGLLMKLAFLAIEIFTLLTMGYIVFDLGSIPSWAVTFINATINATPEALPSGTPV
ncbi:solute carrier family 13 member 2-like [Ornithodoros turicata]|uniref:solute carrier family 13 member 2-like n=1 Tax=Ornithodoros turicata TaxID=34597 RepID=UPI00313A23DC